MPKVTHKLTGNKLYNVWRSIKQRCFNPNSQHYKDYGGRGITLYKDWLTDVKPFYDYVSNLPNHGMAGYTLDRINNDGNYEPGNLRWATASEQRINSRAIARGSKTGYKNIRTSLDNFRVSVTREGVKHNLGTFSTIEKAIEIRDNFINIRKES